jgi:hypothetical protein
VRIAYDLTGKRKTVFKASFGQFFLYRADFATSANPNPPGWYQQYAWTGTNGNGHWDSREEHRLIAVFGATASTTLDPPLAQYLHAAEHSLRGASGCGQFRNPRRLCLERASQGSREYLRKPPLRRIYRPGYDYGSRS